MFGSVSFKMKLGIVVAICLGLILPNHGHGDFFNPLRITSEPLSQRSHQDYTDLFLSGNITLKSVGPPKLIHDFSEVEIGPASWGWGSDRRNALRFYKMDDALYEKLCPSFDVLKKRIYNTTDIDVMEHGYEWGSHPFGCTNMIPRKVDLTKEKLQPNDGLHFASFMKRAEFTELVGEQNFAVRFISFFYHEFPHERLTSFGHFAMGSSIAVQCHGRKLWNFSPPRAAGKYGARGNSGAGRLRGIDEKEPQYVVSTTPGTILTFPPYWAHHVFSYGEPSIMFTVRIAFSGAARLWDVLGRVFFRERWGLKALISKHNMINDGKTVDEMTDKEKNYDLYDAEGCQNEMKEHDMKKMLQMNEKAFAELY